MKQNKRSIIVSWMLAAVFAVFSVQADTYLVRQDAQAGEMADLKDYLLTHFTTASLGAIREGAYETSGSIPSVSTNDLVIFTRSCASSAYDDEGGGEIDAWNSVPAAMLVLHSYMVRADSDQLGWTSGALVTSVSTSNDESVVQIPTDALFDGVTLSPSNTLDLYNVKGVEGNGEGVTGTGGEQLVKDVDGNLLIARFASGSAIETVVSGGVVATHGGDRIYFSMDPGTNSSIADLTADGQTVFNNALEELGLVATNLGPIVVGTTAGAPTEGTHFSGWTSYAQFAADHVLSGGNADMDADPDGDGVINLFEYVWFMDPTLSDATALELSESTPLDAIGTPAYGVDPVGERFSYEAALRNDDPYLLYGLSMVTNLMTGGGVAVEQQPREHVGPDSEVARIESAAGFDSAFAKLNVFLHSTGTVYHIDNQADFDTYKSFTFSPGDQILFKRGEIFSGMFAPQGSGTPGRPILIGNYGTGPMPIINAMGTNPAAILLQNVEQWEIHNMEVTNTDGTTDDQGDLKGLYVLVDNMADAIVNHFHIRDCYVHHVNGEVGGKRRGGIHVHTYNPTPIMINDLLITGNTIESLGGVGIGTDSTKAYADVSEGTVDYLWTDVYVAHNFVKQTGRNAMILRASRDAVVEYNLLANSSRFSTGHSMYNFTTVGFVAQHNEAYGNVGAGSVDRGGFDADFDSMNTLYQYNYSHDNRWCMGIMKKWNKGVTFRYNLSQNDADGFFFFGFDDETDCEDVVIHNNVQFVGAHISGSQLAAQNRKPYNTSFYNNIFYYESSGHYGSGVTNGENMVFSHNAYHGIPAWTHGPGADAHAVTNDPLFVAPGTGGFKINMTAPNRLAGYQLQTNSPCINAGLPILGVDRDFWGAPVPTGSGTDIGLQEVQP